MRIASEFWLLDTALAEPTQEVLQAPRYTICVKSDEMIMSMKMTLGASLCLMLTVCNGQDASLDADATVSKSSEFGRAAVVPAVLIVSGVASIPHFRHHVKKARDSHCPNFKSSADDILMYAPIVATYFLGTVLETENSFGDRTLLMLKSQLVAGATEVILKPATAVRRPHGKNRRSLPSGHATQAFAAATFMHKELGPENRLVSVLGYAAATTVAALRVLNDSHWISDVLIGAGIGMLSTDLVYFTHRTRWGTKKREPKLAVAPIFHGGKRGLALSCRF